MTMQRTDTRKQVQMKNTMGDEAEAENEGLSDHITTPDEVTAEEIDEGPARKVVKGRESESEPDPEIRGIIGSGTEGPGPTRNTMGHGEQKPSYSNTMGHKKP